MINQQNTYCAQNRNLIIRGFNDLNPPAELEEDEQWNTPNDIDAMDCSGNEITEDNKPAERISMIKTMANIKAGDGKTLFSQVYPSAGGYIEVVFPQLRFTEALSWIKVGHSELARTMSNTSTRLALREPEDAILAAMNSFPWKPFYLSAMINPTERNKVVNVYNKQNKRHFRSVDIDFSPAISYASATKSTETEWPTLKPTKKPSTHAQSAKPVTPNASKTVATVESDLTAVTSPETTRLQAQIDELKQVTQNLATSNEEVKDQLGSLESTTRTQKIAIGTLHEIVDNNHDNMMDKMQGWQTSNDQRHKRSDSKMDQGFNDVSNNIQMMMNMMQQRQGYDVEEEIEFMDDDTNDRTRNEKRETNGNKTPERRKSTRNKKNNNKQNDNDYLPNTQPKADNLGESSSNMSCDHDQEGDGAADES
jgi:hypothetical protein